MGGTSTLFCTLLFIHYFNRATVAVPSFEIIAGNCSNLILKDLVYDKHVRLFGMPFVTRTSRQSYFGDYKIYCITARSSKPESANSTVEVVEGGVSHTFATFEMISAVNQGLEYSLNVYANKTAS